MITVSNASADLVLGDNITLNGIPDGTMNLVVIIGRTFTMQGSSRITGHNTTNAAGAIFINGGNFVMTGGTITGNNTSATSSNAVGGLRLSSSTIRISGGTITGNTWGGTTPMDIYSSADASNSFVINGAAVLGHIKLLSDLGSCSIIAIDGNNAWSVQGIHLQGNDASMPTAIGYWSGRAIIRAGGSYTLLANDVTRFNDVRGNFYSSTVGDSQSIAGTHSINFIGGQGVVQP